MTREPEPIDSVAAIRRLPIGTKLRVTRCLLGKCDAKRTIIGVQSKSITLRVDDEDSKNFGQTSWLTFPTGTKVHPLLNGFAVLVDGKVAAEYVFED